MKTLTSAVIAISMLCSSPAYATDVCVSLDRLSMIRDTARLVCRTVAEEKGSAAEILKREIAYLDLTIDERLVFTSLCLLYLHGRGDA